MTAATLTSKGQITVPKEVRDDLGLEPGMKISFIRSGPLEYRLRVKNRSVMELRGFADYEGPTISVEEMDDAIAAAAAEANR